MGAFAEPTVIRVDRRPRARVAPACNLPTATSGMPGIALALVLSAAVLHASWNLLAKSSRGGVSFFWLALAGSAVLYLPAFLVALAQNPIPPEGWPWIAATGVLHAGYFWSLATAYRRADLSVAYPIARGLGPAIVLAVSAVLLREPMTSVGVGGVVVVVAGIYTLNVRELSGRGLLAPALTLVRREGRFAALTGVLIGTYTLVDKQGVELVHPMVYVYLMFAISLLGLSVPAARLGRERLWIHARAEWRRTLAVALLWVAAYLLVLIALRLAPTPYVAAAREVSIVLGAALGILVLREPRQPQRVLGAALIAAGVAAIGLA